MTTPWYATIYTRCLAFIVTYPPSCCSMLQVLWDVEAGSAICGSPVSSNFALTVKFFNNRNDALITGGNYNLIVWKYDKPNNKLRPNDVQLGQLQRIFKSLTVDCEDKFVYCGTSTGDILQVRTAKLAADRRSQRHSSSK
jgi:hypothetical protein